jgi:hypothetical protein
MGLTFVYLGVLCVFVVGIQGGWEDCILQGGERDQQRMKQERRIFDFLNAPRGAGKTQCTKVFASLLRKGTSLLSCL